MTLASLIEMRVNDKDDSGTIISLTLLIQAFLRAKPEATRWDWTLMLGAWGHGEYVCSVEDRLREGQNVVTDLPTLLRELSGEAEYFENVLLVSGPYRIGTFDSTYLFLIAPRDVTEKCTSSFRYVEFVEPGPGSVRS